MQLVEPDDHVNLQAPRRVWYNANVSSVALTPKDVAQEVERLAAESEYGYVHVVVARGRIERIDRCVQIKGAGGPSRPVAAPRGADRD